MRLRIPKTIDGIQNRCLDFNSARAFLAADLTLIQSTGQPGFLFTSFSFT